MNNPASLITDEELAADLAALAVEGMGWQPLGDGAYLHLGKLEEEEEEVVITVVGMPEAGMAGMNVLLVG